MISGAQNIFKIPELKRRILYSFLFLYLAARGGGAFSVDGALRLRKGKQEPPAAIETESGKGPARVLTEADLAEDLEVAELLKENSRAR